MASLLLNLQAPRPQQMACPPAVAGGAAAGAAYAAEPRRPDGA